MCVYFYRQWLFVLILIYNLYKIKFIINNNYTLFAGSAKWKYVNIIFIFLRFADWCKLSIGKAVVNLNFLVIGARKYYIFHSNLAIILEKERDGQTVCSRSYYSHSWIWLSVLLAISDIFYTCFQLFPIYSIPVVNYRSFQYIYLCILQIFITHFQLHIIIQCK